MSTCTIIFLNLYIVFLQSPTDDSSKDEPFAWESREFLRSLLVGEEVYFQAERKPNATRDYGVVYLGKDPNNLTNVTELLVSEGLLQVRREGKNEKLIF